MRPQRALLLPVLLIAGCGEPAERDRAGEGSTTPPYVRAEENALLRDAVTPVRIGELGPSFAACGGRGAVRNRAGGEVPVRAAPYEPAARIDSLAPDAEFFICARTLDQRWFGIVYDEGGRAGERCGVSAPVAQRRDYAGPCAAGWVPSPLIRLVSGVPHQVPAQPAGARNENRPSQPVF